VSKSPEAFRTISEVSKMLVTQAHVLRFWESKFEQLNPVRRPGGRRYYRPLDITLLGGIKYLLHQQGITIKAVQRLLKKEGVSHVRNLSPIIKSIESSPNKKSKSSKKVNKSLDLASFKKIIEKSENIGHELNSLNEDQDDQLHLFPTFDENHSTLTVPPTQSDVRLESKTLDLKILNNEHLTSDYLGKSGSTSQILKLTKKQRAQIFATKQNFIVQLQHLVNQMNS
jgi:DNA-binding transcriptional MerR regulator